MQSRKLQQVGGGTYTVSIPKEWADEHSLQAGMELHLYTHADGSIVLRASEIDGGKLAAARVAVDGEDPRLIERALESIHAVGFETVTLEPATEFTDAQRRAARSVVRNLVGADLVRESPDEITVQHLLDASNVSVRQSVVQLQFTALSVHRQAVAAALDGDEDAPARLSERRDEADRLARMVARHFQRSLVSLDEIDRLGVSRAVLFDHYVTARALKQVTHHSLSLARAADGHGANLPNPVAKHVPETAETVRDVVEDGTNAILDGAVAGEAHSALDEYDGAVAAIDAVERSVFEATGASTPVESVAASVRILNALRATADCGATVANAALRAANRAEHAGETPE